MSDTSNTIYFGLTPEAVISAVSIVTADPVALDSADTRERFARGVLTAVVEPGDRVAGALIRTFGAETLLRVLLDDPTGRQLANHASDVTADEADQFIGRVTPRLSGDLLEPFVRAAAVGAKLLTPADTIWPTGFNDLKGAAPIALWYLGNASAIASLTKSVNVSGTRSASSYGEHVAMELTAGMVDRGYTIVAGGGYGIDGMAHRAAIAAGGITVAFLAGGVDRIHPSGHEPLLTRVADAGAVISELACGATPTRWRFLQRNRLQTAVTQATLIVEASARSGALNVAGHAIAAGRPVGAVPGPVTSALSAGCHRLIRDSGATCVTTVDEFEEMVVTA